MKRILQIMGKPESLLQSVPDRPGHEECGGVRLHRWCQWLSRSHPRGVYDGEEAKISDYTASLAPHLLEHVLLPHVAAGGDAVVLAEEWQTAAAVLELDLMLRRAGPRGRVTLLWNANNLFGFDRIAWSELARAMQSAGSETVADLDPALAGEFARRLWVVPPGGSLL